jgi:hypothetical protein
MCASNLLPSDFVCRILKGVIVQGIRVCRADALGHSWNNWYLGNSVSQKFEDSDGIPQNGGGWNREGHFPKI